MYSNEKYSKNRINKYNIKLRKIEIIKVQKRC